MNPRIASTLVILIAPVLMAAGPADRLSGDLAKIQGDWTVNAGPKRDIPVTLSIKGNEVTVDFASPLGIKIHAEGKVKIDDAASPKTVDWVGFSFVDGQEFPEVLGIYELGDQTLKMVNGGPNDRRPTVFKKGDGALADVLVFTRTGSKVETTRR